MANKNLEDLFNLPPTESEQDRITREFAEHPESSPVPEKSKAVSVLETMGNLEKIESALPEVKGLTASDSEMDELAELAKSSYKDLVDLGMNVEARHSAEILNTASNFLGHAITAKTAKINKKLKMIELQLRKAKLDQDRGDGDLGSANGSVLDRNELLDKILQQNAAGKKSGDE
jgi:hypothetical protein